MKTLQEYLDDAAVAHGHLCAGQVLGVRMAMFGLKKLGLEEPQPTRARISALTIAMSYVVGGLIPLAPYILLSDVQTGLYCSIGVTLLALAVFGFVKGRFTGIHPLKGALQTVVTGGLAAAAAFLIAKLISR